MIKEPALNFEIIEGQTYYMADVFGGRPLLVELECQKLDPDDWDWDYGLYEKKNIIPSKYPLGGYTHPDDIAGQHYSDKERREILNKYFFEDLGKAKKRCVEITFNDLHIYK